MAERVSKLRILIPQLALAAALASGTGCAAANQFKAAISGTSTTAPARRTLVFVDSPSIDLGSIATGATTLIRLPVSTTGSGDATIDSSSNSDSNFAFNGGSFPGTGGTCTQPISGNCSVAVLFTAPATLGSVSNTVTVNYTSGGESGSITVIISVNVSVAASLSINSGSAYAYGSKTIGTSNDATITVTNAGGLTASGIGASGLAAPLDFKGGTYPGTGGTCGTSLASLASCTIVTTFAPVAAVATSSTLTLSYNNGGAAATSTLAISGTGITVASLSITSPAASPFDYATKAIGSTTSQTFTFSNTGGQAATSLAATGLSAPFTFKGGFYPGTGGTCGTTLAAPGTCTMIVDYAPTVVGFATTTLTTTYDNGLSVQTLSRNIQGTGANPASLTLSDGATYDFGQKISGSNTDKSFTLTNSGGVTATGMSGTALAAPYSFKGGAYPGTGGNCGGSLAAAAAPCTIVVRFAPVASGTFNATLTVPYNNGVSVTSATRPITGTGGTVALLSINAGVAFDYGTVNTGTSTDQTFTVANSGQYSATAIVASGLAAPLNFKGGTYPGTGGTCTTTIAGGASCTIVTTYAPIAGGLTSSTLSLSYFNASATVAATLGLSGTAVALASVAITTPAMSPYDYGSVIVGAPAVDLTVTLSNTGGQAATSLASGSIAAPLSFKGGAYPGTGGDCGVSLAASATCTMTVTFFPTSPGAVSDTLVTTYNDGSGVQTLNQAIQGTGVNPALLSISDSAAYDFGSRTVGTNTDHSFTITNSAGATATAISATALVAPFTFKGGAYPGTGGNCGATLGGGATCSIVVRFSPIAAGGFSDTLDLSYNDGLNVVNSTRSMTGTGGTVANLSISDGATYDYGTVAKNYTSDKTFTVTNVGAASASVMTVSGLAAPFDFKGGSYPGTGGNCGATLGAAGTCTLVVTFSPSSATSSTATLSLDYNDSVASTSSTRALAGVGATITKIVGGGSHTCALYSTGVIKCWGSDFYGQLGDGGSNSDQVSPVRVAGIASAVDIAAGSDHTCAVLANGRAMCWGSDSSGQLGNDASLTAQGSAAIVATYTDFTEIAAGGSLTCALRSGGTLACWGSDAEGGVGDDAAFVDMATPQAVSGLTTMTDISVGRSHACARRSTGTFRCWGSDSFGQLGNGGANTNSGIPVTPTPGVATESVAGGDVSCAMISGGTVKCWGADDNGQLGDDAALASQISPVLVSGLANVSSISLGSKHGCSKTATNTMECWGDDFYGQLGDDASTTDQPTPVAVSGIAGVSIIGTGEYHSCVVLTTGAAYCFGANGSGQLGNISPLVQQATPVLVQGL